VEWGWLVSHVTHALQDGDPSKPKVRVPEGYSYEIYNRTDIEQIMVRGAGAVPHTCSDWTLPRALPPSTSHSSPQPAAASAS